MLLALLIGQALIKVTLASCTAPTTLAAPASPGTITYEHGVYQTIVIPAYTQGAGCSFTETLSIPSGETSNWTSHHVSLDAGTRTVSIEEASRWYSSRMTNEAFSVQSCVNDSASTCNSDYSFSITSSVNCVRNADAQEASVKDSGGNTITEIDVNEGDTATVYVQRATNSVATSANWDECGVMAVALSTDSGGAAGNEPANNWATLGSPDADGIRTLTLNTLLDPTNLTSGTNFRLYIIVSNSI